MRVLQLTVLVALVALSGCPKPVDVKPNTTEAPTTTGPTTTAVAPPNNQAGADIAAAERAALAEVERAGMIIYFDYDKAEIKPEFVSVLAAHAKYLNGNVARKARLEGHTDERGSREYNIGLGERRAQAVRRALLLQGVAENQLATVSYGEERPAASGSDETAYGKNRRVEMGYSK